MARFHFPYILTLSLSTLALGAVGCSNGSSPTEPAFDNAPVAVASSSAVSSITGEKRGGGVDPANHDANDDNNNNRRGRGRGQRGRGADDRPRPNAGAEFEGRVVSVSGNTLNLAGGVRVAVNSATQWSPRGDLSSLSQVAAAVAANRPTRVEGRGTRQADGTFLAQTIKAEVDD